MKTTILSAGLEKIEKEWLYCLYPAEELIPGKKVILPWQGKAGSQVQEWNGVIVKPDEPTISDSQAKSVLKGLSVAS